MFLRVCVPACVCSQGWRTEERESQGLTEGGAAEEVQQLHHWTQRHGGHRHSGLRGHLWTHAHFLLPACSGVLSPAGVSIRQRSRCVFEKDVLSLHSFMEQWKPLTSDVCFYFTTVLNMSLCQCEFKRRWRHRIPWWRGFRTTVNINVNINH